MSAPDAGSATRTNTPLIETPQSVQVLEKRIWRSDRLTANGEVQVEYRILDPQGRRVASGIRLVSTAGRAWEPNRGVEAAYPQGPSQAALAKARSRGMFVRLLGR